MPVTSYSRTPASNNSAPPNGAPEGWAPSAVNNTVRQIMTDIVNEAGKGAARVLGTVAGTNTITATMSPALDAYSAGMMVIFTPANTNTGAATISIDGLMALDIQKESAALVAGDLVAGMPAVLVLDSGADDFILINPQVHIVSGTYSPTISAPTNISGSSASTCQWMRVGNVVTVSGAVTIQPTSGVGAATAFSLTLPVASNLAAANQLGGSAAHNSSPVVIQGNAANNVADFTWFSSTASSVVLPFTFTYLIV